MSNIEKIKAEIERRIENYWSDGDVDSVVVSGELEGLIDFIDSLPEEKPSDDLEEAANEYADKHGFRVPYDGSNNYYDDVDVKASKEGFLAGAEWQKEQMMKDAIHYVVQDDLDSHGVSYNIPFLRIGRVALEPKGIGVGDKVKIIIVKQ